MFIHKDQISIWYSTSSCLGAGAVNVMDDICLPILSEKMNLCVKYYVAIAAI